MKRPFPLSFQNLLETIQYQDFFGHKIRLFAKKKNRDTHHTLCGGIISILVEIMILTYFALRLKTLILFEEIAIT